MSRSRIVLLFLLAASLLSISTYAQAAPAAFGGHLSFIVNDNRDLHDAVIDGICEVEVGNGLCTLRAALDEINAAGSGWHSIQIGSMTLTLSSSLGELLVRQGVKVTITGAGATNTIIDGGGVFGVRIFEVDTGAALSIRLITLANGSASSSGAGIQNRGQVEVFQSVLSGHLASASGIGGDPGRGGAIFNESGGVVTILNSTFSNNRVRSSGGAIRNEGYLQVMKSTFDHNDGFAGGGGAIYNKGNATIDTSTFSSNSSAGAGAITNEAGGQIFIQSSTFTDNFTTTGAPWNTLSNRSDSTMTLTNTLVFASQAGSNCSGQVVSFGFNLSNDASCNFDQRGDQQGVDPRLGPLADNGGPTQTHALLAGSAAIDKGFCSGTDQRGYHRPVNLPFVPNARNGCDVGAFEVQR